MPDSGYNASPFVLPNMFGPPGQALQHYIDNQQRNRQNEKQWNYRLQKDQEADEWRKLNLIQDLTDLSKHQTGSDIANAIGDKHASQVLQKYTAAANSMSPAELMSGVQKDMSGLISGMEGMKQELHLSDQQLTMLKQQYPELDIPSLAKNYRAEILSRRLKNENEFLNPLEVKQTEFQLDNPEFLSRFITGNKNISESIINPKGAEKMQVLRGNPNSYTEYTASVPFFKKENFDRSKFKNGFYNGTEEPRLDVKASSLPSDSMPSSNGRPFMVIDQDVYDRFNQDGKTQLELIAATRSKYPQYDSFNPTEKELSKRNVLYDKVKELDKSQYYASGSKTPSAAMIRLWQGGSGSSEKDSSIMINDIYNRVDKSLADREATGQSFLPVSIISPDAKDVIVSQAQKKNKDLTEDDLRIIRGDDGTLRVFDSKGDFVNYVQKVSTNIKAQPSVKEKREVVKQGNQQPQPKAKPEDLRKKYNY